MFPLFVLEITYNGRKLQSLEMTDGLDFKTPKFLYHVINSRYRLDKENPYMQKIMYVLFWMSYDMFVQAEYLK